MPLLLLLFLVAVWLLLKGSGAAPSDTGGDVGTPDQSNLDGMARAVYAFEGGRAGDRNVRNNNPGNLRSGAGMTGKAGGFATFATMADGTGALNDWITSHAAKHPTWDFYDTFNYYLRGSTVASSLDSQGNSDTYAEYVAGQLGIDPTTPVADFLGSGSNG